MYVGIDIGGSKLLAVLVDADGDVVEWTRRPNDTSMSQSELLQSICDVCDEFARSAQRSPVAVGVGYPGFVNHGSGRVRSSVILPRVGGLDLAESVQRAVGGRCFVDNDVNCAALAEVYERSVTGSMLFVAVGTGIGGAVILDGRLWRGAQGVAGEIGHVTWRADGPMCICGARGCLHVYSSGLAVERRLGVPTGSLRTVDGAGLDAAWPIIEESARILGSVLASSANLLDVERVAVGGGLAELGPRYLDAIRRGFDESAMAEVAEATTIEAATVGWRAGALGAARMAQAASPEA
jgi:glucokinase